MPTDAQHERQWKHNLALLDEPLFKNGDAYNDWAITLMFYCAVHLIEKAFDQFGIHNYSHAKRAANMRQSKVFREIRDDYFALENASKKFRYQCLPTPSAWYKQKAYQKLVRIQRCLAS